MGELNGRETRLGTGERRDNISGVKKEQRSESRKGQEVNYHSQVQNHSLGPLKARDLEFWKIKTKSNKKRKEHHFSDMIRFRPPKV